MYAQISATITDTGTGTCRLRVERWNLPQQRYPEFIASDTIPLETVQAIGSPERALAVWLSRIFRG